MKINKILATLTLIGTMLFASAQYDIPITFSGHITNPNSDTLIIRNGWGEQFHVTSLDKNGDFASEFEIAEGCCKV